jgi:hypothetical protein
MEEKINHIFNTVNKIDTTLADQQKRVTKLESTVESLSKELLTLKITVNNREQDLRSNAIRINGFPVTEEEKSANDSKHLAKKIYAKILCPILNAAKIKGHLIEKVPTVENAIVDCFRIGSPATGSTSPIVIKLASTSLRIAIMRAKRESTPPPSEAERALGVKRFIVLEDLTPPTFKKLKELQNCEEISKAWTLDS